MNKHRFRLIFSKKLGFLIPVAENNNAQRKAGQSNSYSGPTRAATKSAVIGTLKRLPLALLSCFTYTAYAEILVEPGQRTLMTHSSSGVPVMEIADPNSKGLSHNRLREFSVSQPGLIFNNSMRNGTSQIGGSVMLNPNLTREAKAILAEVSGTKPSYLSGILEVFGGKADILIAKANNSSINIGGNQTITSVQDTSDMDHTRASWSTGFGVAVSTNGITPTGSGSTSFGKDYDNSKLVAEQAGIKADNLNVKVAGEMYLTGSHIISNPGQGSVDVGGKIHTQTLHDSRVKDGGYAGGGGGINRNGLATVTVESGRVDQVNYQADNLATIDVGDTSKVTAGQGINGSLNTDASKQLDITENSRVAGNDIKFVLTMPTRANKKKDPEEPIKPIVKDDIPDDVVVTIKKPKTETNNNARHMAEATTGTQLKSALNKVNSSNRADQEALKANPITIPLRNADGSVTNFKVSDSNSLQALHGKQVVTGERAESVNYHPKTGGSAILYVKLTPHAYGFSYTLTRTPPAPLK